MQPSRDQGNAGRSFRLQRLGVVMEPEAGNPMQVEGVLNPASARVATGISIFSPVSSAGQLFAN